MMDLELEKIWVSISICFILLNLRGRITNYIQLCTRGNRTPGSAVKR